MSWDMLRELQSQGVTIGSQTHTHPHLHRKSAEQVRQEITTSNQLFLEELGMRPELFAYPFGEYSSFVVDQRHLDTQGRLRTRYACAAGLRPSLGAPNEIENHSEECWNAATAYEHAAISETACTLQF